MGLALLLVFAAGLVALNAEIEERNSLVTKNSESKENDDEV